MSTYDPSLLTVVRANEEQQRRAHHNTFPQWGQPGGLSEEDWENARVALGEGIWAQEDAVVSWVLVPRSDASGSDHILAHCRTYPREALFAHPDSPSAKPTTTYVIGWVYTPPAYRKAGHANQLLSLLHYVLAPNALLPPFPAELWGAEPAVEGFRDASFSILYSGIGPLYYTKVRIGRGPASREGWMPSAVAKRVWNVTEAVKSLGKDLEGLQWFDREGVLELADAEAKEVRRAVDVSLAKQGRRTTIAVVPSTGILAYTAFLNYAGHPSPDNTYGVRLPSSANSADESPFFTYLAAKGTLNVTFVVDPVPWVVVLQAARRESCTRVAVWGEMGDSWVGEEGLASEPEDGPIPAVALYDVGTGSATAEEVEWVANAKYSLF